MRFRANDKFCAQVWDSGRVLIYDNVTGGLRGEYVPESHLQCAANCLAWEGTNILLLGGQDGTVIIFDAVETKVKTYLKKVHAGAVEGFLVLGDRILSCGQDGAIHEYHLSEQTRLKWDDGASDNRPLFSLAAARGGQRVLAAAISQVHVFHADNRTLLKSVTTQHVSPIRFLLSTEDKKVLSCADRHVVVWNKKLHCENTLVLSSSEIIALQQSSSWLAAVSSAGECVLWKSRGDGNGDGKKVVVQLATPAASPLAVHEARLVGNGDATTDESQQQLLLVYGPPSRPRIETMAVPSRNVVLIRDVDSQQQQKLKAAESSGVQSGVPLTQYKSAGTKIIGPLNERRDKSSAAARRDAAGQFGGEDRDEVPLEERLLEVGSDSGKGEELDDQPVANPRTDNMVHLLLQGLQSGDRNMLNAVIFRHDRVVIDNTVRRLPIDAVQLLVRELQDRLHGRPGFVLPALRWARSLVLHHSSYLESCPHLLEPLLYILRSRVTCADRVVEVRSTLHSLLASSSALRVRGNNSSNMEAEINLIEEDSCSSGEEDDDDDEDDIESDASDLSEGGLNGTHRQQGSDDGSDSGDSHAPLRTVAGGSKKKKAKLAGVVVNQDDIDDDDDDDDDEGVLEMMES